MSKERIAQGIALIDEIEEKKQAMQEAWFNVLSKQDEWVDALGRLGGHLSYFETDAEESGQ